MKRKVIQIAGSTQLVSLPRQWAKKNNIQKGQEVEVQEDGDKITISANAESQLEEAEIDISNLGEMIPRCVAAFYKRGVDSLRVSYSDPSLVSPIHEALAKDIVGFEILEQGENACTIKHVAGDVTEFDSVLRRVFLLLNTMSDEATLAFQKKNYNLLRNLVFLEESNNRFTTTCLRYLNTKGVTDKFNKVGPVYYVVEALEHTADQYKYICQYFSNLDANKIKLRPEVLELFERANKIVRQFYEAFYKLDNNKLALMKNERDKIIEGSKKLLQKKVNTEETWLIFHSLGIAQELYQAIDSLLILRL